MQKETAGHSSTLAWRIPWTEETGGLYRPWGCNESDMTNTHTPLLMHFCCLFAHRNTIISLVSAHLMGLAGGRREQALLD